MYLIFIKRSPSQLKCESLTRRYANNVQFPFTANSMQHEIKIRVVLFRLITNFFHFMLNGKTVISDAVYNKGDCLTNNIKTFFLEQAID